MHKNPSSYSYSLLLQFMLSKSLRLYRVSIDYPMGSLCPKPLSSLTQHSLSVWDMGMSCTRKLHFYYTLLLENNSHCPFSLTVGNSLYRLQFALTKLAPSKQDNTLLQDPLMHLVSALLACCRTCDHDVTLLLFLWCKHAQIDEILGLGKVASFLTERFSSKTCHPAIEEILAQESLSAPLQRACHYLKTSYSKKGYLHLLPLIEENFVAMQQWDS